MTPRRHIIAWDRDAQRWSVIDAKTRVLVHSFPSLHAAEEYVLGLKDEDPAS